MEAAIMKQIVEGGALVFTAGDFEVINAARGIVFDQSVDLLGPLLAAPSPGGAELHHEDASLEHLEGVGFAVNPLNLERRRPFADH
jgi:hypothetical protein